MIYSPLKAEILKFRIHFKNFAWCNNFLITRQASTFLCSPQSSVPLPSTPSPTDQPGPLGHGSMLHDANCDLPDSSTVRQGHCTPAPATWQWRPEVLVEGGRLGTEQGRTRGKMPEHRLSMTCLLPCWWMSPWQVVRWPTRGVTPSLSEGVGLRNGLCLAVCVEGRRQGRRGHTLILREMQDPGLVH